MIEQRGVALIFAAEFRDATTGLPKSGLTDVTVTVLRVNADTLAVTGQPAVESAHAPIYGYLMPAVYNTVKDLYVAIFHTDSASVVQKDVYADYSVAVGGIENLDAPISGIPTAVLTADVLGSTVAQLLARIGTAEVYVTSPISLGGLVSLIRGDDYTAGSPRGPIDFTDLANKWPDLPPGTVITFEEGRMSVPCTILVGTGSNKKVRAEPSASDTLLLEAPGHHDYSVRAVFADPDLGTQTLVRGVLAVLEPNT